MRASPSPHYTFSKMEETMARMGRVFVTVVLCL